MHQNALINALAGGGINSLLASKTGNMLANKVANAYRGARGKEKVAYSNFRRGVKVPQAPEQTNSQIFKNIKNVYDDIGIDTSLPKANIVPYDETFARNQTQNSEFIKGDGFRMDKKGKLEYTDRIIYELGEHLKQNVDLNKNPVTASLNFLQTHHPEMFSNRKEAHDTLKKIYNSIPEIIQKRDNGEYYIAKSFIESPSNAKSLMADAIIKPLENENYTKHLNLKAYNKGMREAMESGRNAPPPTHQSELARTLESDNSPGLDSRSLSKADSIIPNQSLNQNITKDDILKEIVNLRSQGFKFGKNMDENLNLVVNKMKNDRLNATNNTRMPNNEPISSINQLNNQNIKDDFITQNITKKQEFIKTLKGEQKDLARANLEKELNITPIKEFGKNYAEFYHNPKGAINKLLAEKQGQVAGAFYRKDLGDITLPFGKFEIKNGKIKGYGVSKIVKKHGKEILYQLDDIITNGRLTKQNDFRYRIEKDNYVVGISTEYKGDRHKFIITAFEKKQGNLDTFTEPNFKANSDHLPANLTDENNIPQNTLNNNKMKKGFTTQAMAKNIVSSGIGGGIGAYLAPEDKKLEGFIIGALGGMGATNFGGISHSTVNLVKNMIKTPKGIDKAIEKGVDKGLVGVANKFLSKEAAKTWSEVGGNVANLKYLFTNTLDKSYEKIRDSVTGELNAMFNKYVNLTTVLNQLSKEDNKAFYNFLANNGSIENLSPEIRKFANDVKNQIVKEFEYQVGAKLIDENTAKEFSGNFLSRIYENEGLKSKFKNWIGSGSSAFGIDPVYKRGLEKTIDLGEYQRLKALGKIAVKGDKGFSTGGKWILNGPYDEQTLLKMANENTKIKIRRDYTAEEREALGEVTDIARVLPQTLYKMASRRINNEFLAKTLDLAKKTDKILAPDELLPRLKELEKAGNIKEIKRLGYQKIPDNDRYGVLKGKFLR